MEERKSIEEIINGKNRCVKTFCVMKMAEGILDHLRLGCCRFYKEFEEHGYKMILILNVNLSFCEYICEDCGIERFLFVNLSEDGLSCEHYLINFSDRLAFKKSTEKFILTEKTETVELYKCRNKDKLELKGNAFDIRVPISCMKELAETMDNLASERKAKHPEYAEEFDYWLNESVIRYAPIKYTRNCRLRLWGINYEKWLYRQE